MYTEKVIEHFKNPKNMGKIENYNGLAQEGNPTCGDIMTIYLRVEKDIIEDIGFETLGCVAAIATSSMVTEIAKGKTLEEAEKIEFKDVVNNLGGLPPIKIHCSNLAVAALKSAIRDYKLSQNSKGKIQN